MKTLPLNNTPYSRREFHVNDDEFVVNEVQDVSPILDFNKERQNHGHNPKAEMRHAASVPMAVWNEWMKEFVSTRKIPWTHAPNEVRRAFMAEKLNDPNNGYLRTWKGKL